MKDEEGSRHAGLTSEEADAKERRARDDYHRKLRAARARARANEAQPEGERKRRMGKDERGTR